MVKYMVLEYILGMMVENMKENILRIRNKDLENIIGVMVENMKDFG